MPFSIFAAEADEHKKVKFHPRILGSPAPMFPGYEVDICDPVDDNHKPDAVWHRDKQMIRNHPEIKQLFGNTPSTALWCIAFFTLQVALSWGVSRGPWWLMILVAYFIASWTRRPWSASIVNPC
jgi:sphingolipid delta-4 desaturase